MIKNRPLILIFMVLMIAPNAYQVLSGHENFPFSNNPMFGHYVTNEDELVTLTFLVETPSGTEKLDYDRYGFWEVRFKRFYFSQYYGSSEKNSPQGNKSPSKEVFVKNNEVFFSKLYDIVSQKDSDIKRLHLVMDYLSIEGEPTQRKEIGYFDPGTKKFVLL